MPRLIDYFPDWANGDGIFSHMSSPSHVRWTGADLDRMYFSEYGERTASPLVEKFSSGGTISGQNLTTLSRLLQSRFAEPWKRRLAVLASEYTPTDNYNMVERETIDRSIDEQDSSNTSTGASVYGFNADEPTPTGTGTDTTSIQRTGSNTDERDLTRRGNIGVTTTQQMLESEIKLWEWDYLAGVFGDANKLLTIPIYE